MDINYVYEYTKYIPTINVSATRKLTLEYRDPHCVVVAVPLVLYIPHVFVDYSFFFFFFVHLYYNSTIRFTAVRTKKNWIYWNVWKTPTNVL